MRRRPPGEPDAAGRSRALDELPAESMERAPFGAGFTELYHRIIAAVASAARRKGVGAAEAEELGHDAAATVWAERDRKLKGWSVARVLAWARGVGRNALANQRRDERKLVDLTEAEDSDPDKFVATANDPERALLQAEVRRITARVAATWSEPRRQVFALVRAGLTYPQIAAQLGISVHTVHAHVVRGSKRLRLALGDYDPSIPLGDTTEANQRRDP